MNSLAPQEFLQIGSTIYVNSRGKKDRKFWYPVLISERLDNCVEISVEGYESPIKFTNASLIEYAILKDLSNRDIATDELTGLLDMGHALDGDQHSEITSFESLLEDIGWSRDMITGIRSSAIYKSRWSQVY